MDKGNGQLLQSFRGHTNQNYRIRSCLGMADSVVISGSEDGQLYAWDLLEGKVIEKLEAHSGKVASAVACNGVKKEWASAGVDGEILPFLVKLDAGSVPNRHRQCLGHARVNVAVVEAVVANKPRTNVIYLRCLLGNGTAQMIRKEA